MTIVSSSKEDEPESKAKARSSLQSFPGHETATLRREGLLIKPHSNLR